MRLARCAATRNDQAGSFEGEETAALPELVASWNCGPATGDARMDPVEEQPRRSTGKLHLGV